MAIAAAEPAPAAVMTWARGLTTLPATQTPSVLVRPVASAVTKPASSTAHPSPASRPSGWATLRGRMKTAVRGTIRPPEAGAASLE